jgi:hypothetical protein
VGELGISGEDVDALRLHVKPLLDWACAGGKLDERHPHYTAVTEGRDPANPKYSSCGDLAHWELFRLGCRQHWVNRKEHLGWGVGQNVSRLAFGAPTSVRRTPRAGARFETGDVLIVWNKADGTDAHVMVVYEFAFSPLRLVVAEYGQPGGHIAERKLTVREGELYVGSRQIQRWMPLALALTDAAERGLLEPPSFPWRHDTEPAPSLPPESNR